MWLIQVRFSHILRCCISLPTHRGHCILHVNIKIHFQQFKIYSVLKTGVPGIILFFYLCVVSMCKCTPHCFLISTFPCQLQFKICAIAKKPVMWDFQPCVLEQNLAVHTLPPPKWNFRAHLCNRLCGDNVAAPKGPDFSNHPGNKTLSAQTPSSNWNTMINTYTKVLHL